MTSSTPRMPAIFFGHGNPMYALEENRYTDAWRRLGALIPRPKAILSVSAHWYVSGVAVTVMERPRTIHDFDGFPKALFEVQYPVPGDPALAHRVRHLLAPSDVRLDSAWGIDHGAWSVLSHAFPAADIPVVQLSIDRDKPPAYHYELAARLAPLREEGVLIMGSGNVVHNLRLARFGDNVPAFDWAVRFNEAVRALVAAGDHAALADYAALGEDARLSIPTPEHFLPLLYVLAQRRAGESISFPVDGVELGSISMLSVVVGEGA